MLSRWLRWLVVAPVVLFVFGALMLSCGGGSSTTVLPTPSPGFALEAIQIQQGPLPTPTFGPTPTPKHTVTPTVTPSSAASPTTVPTSVPIGGTVSWNALGTFVNHNGKIQFQDITTSPGTLWTSSDSTVLLAPPPGPDGGMYTTEMAGCVCILASNSGVSGLPVQVGVYVDVDTCPLCPTPFPPTPTATSTPKKGPLEPEASSTPAPSTRSAGVLMWDFDSGSELRGRIAVRFDGSIFFITRDSVMHGLDPSGKEIMHTAAEGSSPAVLAGGNVVAMSSKSALAELTADGITLWNLEIGASDGPLATTDHAIYAAVGDDLVSVSAGGTLNWRVSVGSVASAATTADGVVVGARRGAVTALAADGAVIWTFQPEGGFSGSVAYADDVVYAGSAGGGVYALDARTGNLLWHVNSAHAVTTGPAVASSGTIFAGADTIYGVAPDGQLRWQNPAMKPGSAGLFVLGYDSVFDAATGDIGAVLTGDGSYVWTSRSFGTITTAASSASGTLYVGTSTGRIFAIK